MSKGEPRSPSQRQMRVAEEVRHALAMVIERGEIRDPGLAGVAVTVTEVRMSPDLRHATAFVTRLGGGTMDGVLDALHRARPFLRRRVAAAVRLKFAPDLAFREDTVFEQVDQIGRLLRTPEVARDLDAPEEGGGDGT